MGETTMKLFYLAFVTPFVQSNCAEQQPTCAECMNWAAYMPGYFYSWTGPNNRIKNNCKLFKKTGWKRETLKGACSGESRGSTVWWNTILKNGGDCGSCAPQGCN